MNTFSGFQIKNTQQLGFDPNEYSRFKYGSKSMARKFGKALAEKYFQSTHFHNLINTNKKQIVISSSPYCNIPTATYAMKNYFVAELNRKLIEFDVSPVQEVKIYRTLSYNQDYGAMSKDERDKAISGDEFYIDKEFVNNKHVIFLDDIKITGAHERRIQKMINNFKLKCDYTFMYFAELIDESVDPTLENFLNFHFIKSIMNIDWIIKNDKFIFNTRVVKYILNTPGEQFKTFVNYQSEIFRDILYKEAISNSYHKFDEFKPNLEYLKSIL